MSRAFANLGGGMKMPMGARSSSGGGGGMVPPEGFAFVVDGDGKYVVDGDGAYVVTEI